jgi:hypothetical protein
MITRGRVALTLYLTVGAWLLFVPAASAYLDPGSTSVIFGALVAGAMTAGMTLKLFWRRVARLFGRKDDTAEAAGDQVDADAP